MGIGRDQMAPACLSYPGRTSHAQGIAAALIATATNKNAVVLGVLALWRELDLRPLPIPRRYCFQISSIPTIPQSYLQGKRAFLFCDIL